MAQPFVRNLGALLCCALLVAAIGCSKSSTTAAPATSVAGMSTKSLVDQLGGMQGVTSLANSFASNMSASPSITKFLNPEAISNAKLGLMNEVAKASNVALPNPGVDLKQVLSGKGMDAEGVGALTNALASAADTQKLDATQKTAVMALMDPISKSILGN